MSISATFRNPRQARYVSCAIICDIFYERLIHVISIIRETQMVTGWAMVGEQSGLLQLVVDYKSTIGYAGLDSVQQEKGMEDEFDTCVLRVAKMKNREGYVVAPTADSAQAAVRSKAAAFASSACPGFGLCAEVHDGQDADVWPISTLTVRNPVCHKLNSVR
jgi:hypothetical protein